jgi:hypothetical protein
MILGCLSRTRLNGFREKGSKRWLREEYTSKLKTREIRNGARSPLIANYHPIVRTALWGMLAGRPDFEVVREAANGAETIELTGRLRPRLS